ncbi:MAG: M20/M25/M40 family metallo-hydrolase [Opitutaceae bacterium]|nr:M20/M25/M40 family metallo-hydrolase [Opitutaceae bacterium]
MTSSPAAAPQSCEELLAQMIAIETVNPLFDGPADGQERLIAHLESLAKTWGLRTQRLPVPEGGENLLISIEVDAAAPWLLFESHVDTVSIAGMTIDPLKVITDGDKLHGRGACDTKGSGAAMLWALRDYARGAVRPHNVGLLFALDEEARMTGAKAFAARELKTFLPKLRGVIVGEPTLMRPVVATNGVMRWKTITRGRAAHSSVPANGQSAISAMLRVVDALESRYAPTVTGSHPLTGRAAMSVNVSRGGTQVNIIPEYCEIECDRRTIPGETEAQIWTERDAVLAGMEVEHTQVYVVPSMGDELSRDFLTLLQPVQAKHGLATTGRGEPYVTDASHFAAAGAAAIVIGPGDLAQAHTKDEWVSRRQLAQAVAVYGDLMKTEA